MRQKTWFATNPVNDQLLAVVSHRTKEMARDWCGLALVTTASTFSRFRTLSRVALAYARVCSKCRARPLTFLDLFSGTGGFALGLEWAGMDVAAFCEIDPWCQERLAELWPEVPIYDDIRRFDGQPLRGSIDLICGGFPCQPWSVAGTRSGEADPRDLWPEMRRVIDEVRPGWVVGENVPGIDTRQWMGLDRVCADLEASRYAVWPFEIPACAVNLPQLRNRVWIVAHRDDGLSGGARQTVRPRRHTADDGGQGGLFDVADADVSGQRSEAHAGGHRQAGHDAGGSGPGLPVADNPFIGHETGRARAGRKAGGDADRLGGGEGSVGHAKREGLQRHPGYVPGSAGQGRRPHRSTAATSLRPADHHWVAGWDGRLRRIEPGVRPLVDGLSRQLASERVAQIKAIGNAVVPQLVEQIGRAIIAAVGDQP